MILSKKYEEWDLVLDGKHILILRLIIIYWNLQCTKKGVEIKDKKYLLEYFLKFLLIRDMVVACCNGRFGCETIHPTVNLISMNLLQMSYHGHDHFWPSRLWRLLEARNIISWRTLWHFNSMFGSSLRASSAYQRLTKKFHQLWPSASIQPAYLEF